MNGRSAKESRRLTLEAARKATDTLGEPIMAALQNESLTRERVTALEEWKGGLDWRDFSMKVRLNDLESFRRRSLLGRLRWLFTGR